jgi:hypothetical protein
MDKGKRDREDMLPVDVGEGVCMDPDGYILGTDALRILSTLLTIKKSAPFEGKFYLGLSFLAGFHAL